MICTILNTHFIHSCTEYLLNEQRTIVEDPAYKIVSYCLSRPFKTYCTALSYGNHFAERFSCC